MGSPVDIRALRFLQALNRLLHNRVCHNLVGGVRLKLALATDVFDEYMIIVRQTGGHYELRRFKATRPVKGYKINGHKYVIRKKKAFLLKGWFPWTDVRFFQSIIDLFSHRFRTIGLLLYEEPSYETEDWTEPLDRIESSVTDPSPIDILTPDLHRIIADSKLYSDAMRRIHPGSAISWKFLALMLAVIVVLMVVLNAGGYLD